MTTAKQSELLFLWDARMTNPNGDMLNDNAPRYDEADRRAIVSDVRVKRTIRDDLQDRQQESVFVNNAEEVISAETRFKEVEKLSGMKDREAFLSCIDNRLFGGVAPKSLNETETVLGQGTGAFGKDNAKNKTFRTDNYIPYGLFAMYGTINALNAQKSKATEEDVNKMLDSMWNGTKLLNTRSKTGQKPRFLLRVIYKDSYMIGLLDELVELSNEATHQIRKFEECEVDFTLLIEAFNAKKDKIEKIIIQYDRSMESQLAPFEALGIELETIEA